MKVIVKDEDLACFIVVIKLTFEYLSPVFDTEDKMAL
jgi:hypothetical protein